MCCVLCAVCCWLLLRVVVVRRCRYGLCVVCLLLVVACRCWFLFVMQCSLLYDVYVLAVGFVC